MPALVRPFTDPDGMKRRLEHAWNQAPGGQIVDCTVWAFAEEGPCRYEPDHLAWQRLAKIPGRARGNTAGDHFYGSRTAASSRRWLVGLERGCVGDGLPTAAGAFGGAVADDVVVAELGITQRIVA